LKKYPIKDGEITPAQLIQNIQMFMNNSYDKNLSSKINMEELYKLTNPQYFDLNP
jgi:hypothetical protein